MVMLSVVLITGCGGGGETGHWLPNSDTIAPTVTNTIHANGATDVPINTRVGAVFSEEMDPATITSSTFTLRETVSGAAVAGTVSYTGVTSIFIPASNLANSTNYTVTVKGGSNGAKDLAGNPLASDFVIRWTTSASLDTTAPTVTNTIPVNGATGVPINIKVGATFSEWMDPLTITSVTFKVKETVAGTTVAGTLSYTGVNVVFIPLNSLANSRGYTVTIKGGASGAKDLAGNPLASDYVWSWTTGAALDTTAPTVTATVHANGATGVPINTKSGATFSKVMDPGTITNLTYTMKETIAGTAVPGILSYSGVNAVFIPLSNLINNTRYTLTVKGGASGVKDLAGNALASDYVWSWTTSAAIDAIKPRVISTTPSNVTGVLTNTKVTPLFSEAMDPLTITTETFTLTAALTAVPGTVTYSGRSAVFSPATLLQPSTTYTATITTGAKDLAGNQLAGNQAPLPAASNYVWSFTTALLPDTIAPTVTLTKPVHLATGVALNSSVNATFSKEMDPLTINNLGFTVSGKTGLVSYDPLTKIATFKPSSNLAGSTTYTATITGAQDLAGNALVSGLVPNPWTFTTGTLLAPGAVALGRAGTFGIMATASTSSTGATMINGDVALNPGTSQAIPVAQVNGTIHVKDQVAIDAQTDLTAAFIWAMAQPSDATTPTTNLGAWIGPPGNTLPLGSLPPGVYTSGSSMSVNTPLTLDAGGNVDAVWIFQMGSSLTTVVGGTPATGGNIILTNGAQAKNVFWVVGSSAVIGINTTFNGSILASADITGQTGATIYGRLFAGESGAGAIVLDSNTVNVPDP